MFERLVKARADVERNVRKLQEAQKKYDAAVERLKEVEKTEILELVTAQKMTPEELAEFLGMGEVKLPTVADSANKDTVQAEKEKVSAWSKTESATDENLDVEETEDNTDENY
jgi:hypothetical protein